MRAPHLDLPDDPSIEQLPDDLRRSIAEHWRLRAAAELGVAFAFGALLPRLRDLRAPGVVLGLVEKAIDDERRHGELCVRLASRYLGAEVSTPPPRGEELPCFGTNDEPLEVALVVTGTCCINESIACEWIRSSWAAARFPTAIQANQHHLEDEIDHARLGWAYLNALDPRVRDRLRRWTARLLAANVEEWRKPDASLPPEGVPPHGHLSLIDSRAAIDAAVRDVVLPGLAHVGLG